jgi:hypothetical protein
MADNNIARYLRKSFLYALLLNPFIAFLSVQIVNSRIASSLEGNQAVFIVSLLGIFCSLILTICSATIFLNVYPSFRKDNIYVFFSYYAVPIIAAMLPWTKTGTADTNMLSTFFAVTIPFFALQTFFYLKFLKMASKL